MCWQVSILQNVVLGVICHLWILIGTAPDPIKFYIAVRHQQNTTSCFDFIVIYYFLPDSEFGAFPVDGKFVHENLSVY